METVNVECHPDASEECDLRALVRDAITDAARTGSYTVTLGRYRVRAVRQSLPLDERDSVRVEFEVSDQQRVIESGVVNLQRQAGGVPAWNGKEGTTRITS